MPDAQSVPDLLDRVRNGDPDAAARLFNCFTQRLRELARAHLDKRLQRHYDSEDIVQSVYRSFLRRLDRLRVPSEEALWGLLSVMTVRRCHRRAEHAFAACRDVRLEVGLPPDALIPLPSSEPQPAEAAELADLVESVLSRLDPRDRDIVVLCLQGYTVQEISERTACAYRTVRRIIDRARRWLLRQWNDA